MEFTTENVFSIFLIVSAIHGFLFSIVLFFSKNGWDKSLIYLNLLVLSISLNNFQSWVLENHLFQHKFMLDYIQIPWHFLTAPFFYMFLVHYLNIAERSLKILRFVIPIFLVGVALQIGFVSVYSGKENIESLDFIYEKYTSLEEIVSLVFSLGIFIYSFYILYKKEKLFPKILSYDNLQWIYTFFKLGALTYISWILALVIKIQMNFTGFLFSYYPLRILTTLLIYWIGYQGFTQLRLLKERKLLRAQISIDKQFVQEQPEAREDINTIDEKIAHQFAKIDDYIKTEKKYLQTKYTLDNLCDDLGFSSSTLSHIINSGAKRSFSDYMNELRVEQAKKLLLSGKYKEYTIAAIGLESGFNSKSSFYHVFKKHTDHTPAQYKTAFSSKLSQN